jgi:hypothetical protein
LFLQTALSSDGLLSIFKTDPQKKADKELSVKVRFTILLVNFTKKP